MKKWLLWALCLCMTAGVLYGCRRPNYLPPAESGTETESAAPDGTTGGGSETDAPHPGTSCGDEESSREPGTEPGSEPGTEPDPAESDTSAEGPAVEPLVFGVNPFAGMTKTELADLYRENARVSYFTTAGEILTDTPYFAVFGATMAFNKLTGQLEHLCREPDCDHLTCPFSHGCEYLTVMGDRIYMLTNTHPTPDGPVYLYSFDWMFEDPVLVHVWATPDEAPIRLIGSQGGRLFFVRYEYEKTEDGRNLTYSIPYVMDAATGTESLFETDNEALALGAICVSGEYLYYDDEEDKGIRRLNLVTGEDEDAVPASILNPEIGELGVMLQQVPADGRLLSIIVIGKDPVTMSDASIRLETRVYDTETGTMTERRAIWSGGISVRRGDRSTEAYADDPFYDLYTGGNPSGGELWYTDDTGVEKRLLYAATDGIPDNLKPNGSNGLCYILDMSGHIVYVSYSNYRGYNNPYRPETPKTKYHDPSEPRPVTDGLMIIDVDHGTVYILGPAHDAIVFPDQ